MDAKTIGGVVITPTLVAELFWSMDSEQQADFVAAAILILALALAVNAKQHSNPSMYVSSSAFRG